MERTRGPEFRRKCVPYYVQHPLRQPRHAPERAKIGTPDHFRLERPGDHAPAGSRRAIKGGGTAHAVRRRAAAAALIVSQVQGASSSPLSPSPLSSSGQGKPELL